MEADAKHNSLINSLLTDYRLALIIVLIIGLSGSSYVLGSIYKEKVAHQQESIQWGTSKLDTKNSVLRIAGKKITAEAMTLIIEGFNPRIEYFVNLGAGESIKLTKSHSNIKFLTPGKQKIQLFSRYKGSTQMIDEISIEIKNNPVKS